MDRARGSKTKGIPSVDRAEEDRFMQEAPPVAVGQSERRMQVRAYNFWAGLLGARALPPLAALAPQTWADFGPHGVVIDLTGSTSAPGITHLGTRLAAEYSHEHAAPVTSLADVPDRSLLSRLTSNYRQVLTNNAPLSFEGEFSNTRGVVVQYRGILLPFSDDDSRVERIFGVINWRELAEDALTHALHTEVKAALQCMPAVQPEALPRAAMSDWADGPAAGLTGALPYLAAHAEADHPLQLLQGSALAERPPSIPTEGPDYALVMVRREPSGQISLLGEVPSDPVLLDRATRLLLNG